MDEELVRDICAMDNANANRIAVFYQTLIECGIHQDAAIPLTLSYMMETMQP